jgi:hypothetical protein
MWALPLFSLDPAKLAYSPLFLGWLTGQASALYMLVLL